MGKRDAVFYGFAGVLAVLVGVAAALQASILAVAAVVTVAIIVVARLDWWQRLYVLTLILMMGATSNIEPLIAVSNYLRYVAAAALLGVTWSTSRKTTPIITSQLHSRTLKALWFTVALAAASVVWSVSRAQSAQQVVALIILVGLVQLLSTRRWTDRDLMVRDFRIMFNVLVAGFLACLGAAVAGHSAAYSFAGTEDTIGRFQGVFNNPNMLAILAAISIPLGWGLLKEQNTVVRFAMVLPAVIVLLLSESRTAIVATAAAFAWMILRSGLSSVVKFAYAGFIGVVVLLATGTGILSSAFSRFGSLEGGDVLNTRGDAWSSAINLVKERPLGYGWQAGAQLFESLHGMEGFTFTRTSVHNSYLQFVLELGFLGIIPIIYFVFALIAIALRGRTAGLELGFVGVAVAGLLVQITESAIFGTGQAYPYVFWFAMAGALTLYKTLPSRTEIRLEERKRKALQEAHKRMELTVAR